jgi:hypothetical protein
MSYPSRRTVHMFEVVYTWICALNIWMIFYFYFRYFLGLTVRIHNHRDLTFKHLKKYMLNNHNCHKYMSQYSPLQHCCYRVFILLIDLLQKYIYVLCCLDRPADILYEIGNIYKWACSSAYIHFQIVSSSRPYLDFSR